MRIKNKHEKAYDTLISIYHDNDNLVNELHDLKELVDRSVPTYVKAYRDGVGDATVPNGCESFNVYYCPSCNEELNEELEPNYCPFCGQSIKWFEEAYI